MKPQFFKRTSIRHLAFAATFMLTILAFGGCDGGSSTGGASNFTPVPQEPSVKAIGGTAQGLNGFVTLNWATSSLVVAPGAFSSFPAFDAGDSFTLSLSNDPLGQVCVIDGQTDFVNQEDDVLDISITCIDQNLVQVRIENFFTGEPMAGISFTVHWVEDGQPQTFNGTVDSEGRFDLELATFEGRVIVNADIDGFGEQSAVVVNTSLPATRIARLLMQTRNLGTTFDATVGASLNVEGETLVSIPANAMIDASGTPYTGQVTTELTVVDPTVSVEVMPGDYLSRDMGGAVLPMQSYGAISVTFVGAGGETLNLAAGQTASINIPVAQAELFGSPVTVPLFSYDPISGYWAEEGQAALTTLGSGMRVYAGQVSHFTTWNADVTYDPVFITGCVVNAMGTSLDNVRINGVGVNYLGSTHTISSADGMFSLPVRANSSVLISTGDGLQSQTLQVNSGPGGAAAPECLIATTGGSTVTLTWGEDPSDLDTRFFGRSAVNSADDFHVDYTQRSVVVNGITIDLDVDDVTSFGPEVVTIPAFPYEGVYRYSVHLFSGSGSIQASPARVELNLAGDTSVYIPPTGTPTECWAVFDIAVDISGFPTLTELGTWEAESYCTSGDFPNPVGASASASAPASVSRAPVANPLSTQIRRKYYGG
jgi:uncharacterized protein YfaP (DUF2135 family)